MLAIAAAAVPLVCGPAARMEMSERKMLVLSLLLPLLATRRCPLAAVGSGVVGIDDEPVPGAPASAAPGAAAGGYIAPNTAVLAAVAAAAAAAGAGTLRGTWLAGCGSKSSSIDTVFAALSARTASPSNGSSATLVTR